MSINKTNHSHSLFRRLSALAFVAFATLAIAAPASAQVGQIDLWVGGISEARPSNGVPINLVDKADPQMLDLIIHNASASSAAGVPLGWSKVGSGMVLALLGESLESRNRTGIGGLELVFKLAGGSSSHGSSSGNVETSHKVGKGEK